MFLLFIHTGQYRKCTSVRERGGDGIRKDLELGLFQGSPKAQPRYMHKAVGSNILSEFEETFLLKILNAFHSRQRFSCVKNFLWLSTKLRQSYPLPPTWFLLQVSFSFFFFFFFFGLSVAQITHVSTYAWLYYHHSQPFFFFFLFFFFLIKYIYLFIYFLNFFYLFFFFILIN